MDLTIVPLPFSWLLADFLTTEKLTVGFYHLDSPLNPGDPLVFQWRALPRRLRPPLDLGDVSVSLHLADEFGNPDPGAILYSDVLSAADTQRMQTRSFYSPLLSASPPTDLERRVYRVGTHMLRLVLKGTGTDGGPFVSQAVSIQVLLPAVDDSWWSWTVSTDMLLNWKRDSIPLAGTVNNRSKQAVSFSATLLEENSGSDALRPGINPIATSAGGASVAGGGTNSVAFTPLPPKTWQWFLGGIWVPSGPVFQSYEYRVRLDLVDQYMNAFPSFIPAAKVRALVGIPTDKAAALAVATGLMAAAAYWLAVAAVAALGWIPGLIEAGVDVAIAGALASAAQVSGLVANDPPVPDSFNGILYDPISVSIPDHDEARPFLQFLQVVCEVIAHAEAIAQTESRIVGAQAEGSSDAVIAQTGHRDELINKAATLADNVASTLPDAMEFLSERLTLPAPVADRVSRELTHNSDLRATMLKEWLAAGGILSYYESLEQLYTFPEFNSVLTNPGPAMSALGHSAETLVLSISRTVPS